jgi:hypothetical protein
MSRRYGSSLRNELELMFAYRERRLRALAIAGVARVKFPTAGILEFKADLASFAVVGFATVPPAPFWRE